MCLAQGPQRSDAGEAQTRGLSVSSQALYHRATALPNMSYMGLKTVLWGTPIDTSVQTINHLWAHILDDLLDFKRFPDIPIIISSHLDFVTYRIYASNKRQFWQIQWSWQS